MHIYQFKAYAFAITLALTSACPLTAHHGENVMAGLMGAGFGMMAGLAMSDHHDCSGRYNHYTEHYHCPTKKVVVYDDYVPAYYRPVREVRVYRDYPVCSHSYYHDYPWHNYSCADEMVVCSRARPAVSRSFSMGWSF